MNTSPVNRQSKFWAGDNPAIQRILNLIMQYAPVTRTRLSKLSGYSRSTITVNCDKLLKASLIVEENYIHNGSISKRTKLRINANAGIVIGVELGATRCELGVCNPTGSLMEYHSIVTDLGLGPEPVLASIEREIDAILEDQPKGIESLLGIGIGLPSPVDYARGMAYYPAFMPGWHLFPVGEVLNQKYNCPVFVDNEVNTMALGEFILGNTHKARNYLFIKAGTGIGAGIILEGQIFRGEKGLSGNIGHINVTGYDDPCTCGKQGCLEAIVGSAAIAQRAQILVETGKSPALKKIVNNLNDIKASEIRAAANEGDEECLSLIREAGALLGNVIGKLVIMYDPASVVIGGRLTEFGPLYLNSVRDAIMVQCSPWFGPDFPIYYSEFGDKSGIIGSAMLCIRSLFENGYLINRRS